MGDSEKLVMEIMKELYPKQYKKILKKNLKLNQKQKEVLLEKVTAVIHAGKKIKAHPKQVEIMNSAKKVVMLGVRRNGKASAVSSMVSDAVVAKAKAVLIAGGGLLRPVDQPGSSTNFLSTPQLRLHCKNIGGMGFAIYKMNKKMLRAVINAHAIGDTNEVSRIVAMAKAGGRM